MIDEGNAPPMTGIGVYGSDLRSALQAHAASEVTVSEASASWTGLTLRPIRRVVHTLRLNRLRRTGFNGADVVHFTNYYVPRRSGTVAYVSTVHDLDPILLPSAHTRRYASYFSAAVRSTVAHSHVIVVNTETVRQELLAQFKLDPAGVLMGGQGLSASFTRQADVTKKILPEIPTLLYVGLINNKKNSPWLVGTVARGVRSGALPKLRLILAGRGGLGFEEVRREFEKAPGIVEWHRTPSLQDLIRLYCSCTAVVLPSLREGFGRPLLEGMYCGKSLVASRIPSSVEVAGDAAIFFELGDEEEFYQAVRAAIAGTNRERQVALAAQRLRHYSWERLAGVYLSIYQAAINRAMDFQSN